MSGTRASETFLKVLASPITHREDDLQTEVYAVWTEREVDPELARLIGEGVVHAYVQTQDKKELVPGSNPKSPWYFDRGTEITAVVNDEIIYEKKIARTAPFRERRLRFARKRAVKELIKTVTEHPKSIREEDLLPA